VSVNYAVDVAYRRSGSFTRETVDAEVTMLAGRTRYQSCGDWPAWLSVKPIR
jgi:apolipoprotein N-acyltransferase